MGDRITYQKLKKVTSDSYELARKYYGLLSVLNGLSLTERELQLVSYASIKGNISLPENRQEFCEKYGTSEATINNMVSKLKKASVFIKAGGRVIVNPHIVPNFKGDLVLQITLRNGAEAR